MLAAPGFAGSAKHLAGTKISNWCIYSIPKEATRWSGEDSSWYIYFCYGVYFHRRGLVPIYICLSLVICCILHNSDTLSHVSFQLDGQGRVTKKGVWQKKAYLGIERSGIYFVNRKGGPPQLSYLAI